MRQKKFILIVDLTQKFPTDTVKSSIRGKDNLKLNTIGVLLL
ncbi:MAG TPA: hypothetical protein PLN01_09690 [Spirochaetota bacterium]|nr:hypothetical protein [Spirochaetota bacterium]